MRWVRILAASFVAAVPGFFAASPATAAMLPGLAPGCVGSSLCNPANAPLLLELAGPGAGGAGAVAAGGAQTGSLATSATAVGAVGSGAGVSVAAEALGGTAGLLLAGGGLLPWVMHVLDPSGLPTGATTIATSTDGTYWTTGGGFDPVNGRVTVPVRPRANEGGTCWGVPASGVPTVSYSWGNQTAYGMTYYAPLAGGYPTGAAGATTAVRCFLRSTSMSPAAPNVAGTFASAAALLAYAPPSGLVVSMVGGDFGTGGNPARTVQQTVTCKRADGTTHTISNTSSSAVWTAGQLVEVAGLMCPDGERAEGATAVIVTPGATDTTVTTVTQPETVGELPRGCDFASAHCILDLQRLTSTSTWASCFASPEPCVGLFELPVDVQTSQYRCVYGNGGTVPWVARPWAECRIYDRIFDAGEPGVGLNPDPDLGEDFCSLSWGDVLNGSVVYKAVACALKWAFVPRSATMTAYATRITTAWSGSAPGVVADAASDVGAPLRDLATVDDGLDPDSCLGPEVDWPWGFLPHAHPFSTCEGLPATMSAYLRPIIGAVALILAFRQALRVLGHTLGLSTPQAV